jgi:two-component sensor histidine kinase
MKDGTSSLPPWQHGGPMGQGLELLRHLARQLGGDIEQGTPERGTSMTVRFPLVV